MTDAWPAGVGLRRYEAIDSTNEEARRLAASGEGGPLWIVARAQTSGRGRRGRVWVSQAGNLFATLLIGAPQRHAAELGFAASLAAADLGCHYAPCFEVKLKWPNDVLLEGKKVAGILLEHLGQDRLAIGIGVNLAHYPLDTEFPATAVHAITGAAPEPDEALAVLATRMATWYEVRRSDGFASLRTEWLKRAAGLGSNIRARLHEGEMEGVFEDLDENGALILRSPSGARSRIAAGDVFFRA